MKKTKFRAWDTKGDVYTYGEWGGQAFPIFIRRTNNPRYIIEESAGVLDIMDKEVYENDYIRIVDVHWVFQVKWLEDFCCFVGVNISDDSHDIILPAQSIKVVGNVNETSRDILLPYSPYTSDE